MSDDGLGLAWVKGMEGREKKADKKGRRVRKKMWMWMWGVMTRLWISGSRICIVQSWKLEYKVKLVVEKKSEGKLKENEESVAPQSSLPIGAQSPRGPSLAYYTSKVLVSFSCFSLASTPHQTYSARSLLLSLLSSPRISSHFSLWYAPGSLFSVSEYMLIWYVYWKEAKTSKLYLWD